MIRVAYATRVIAEGEVNYDDEMPLVLDALPARGLDAEAIGWDDPAADWATYDAVLVRSTWNYVPQRSTYLAWAARVAASSRLLNAPEVIERNTDKTYLREVGVATVPTLWVAPDQPLPPLPSGVLVAKPTVSANALDTVRSADLEVIGAHAAMLAANGRTAMIQPFLAEVEQEGEISLVHLGGRFSHAVRKSCAFDDDQAAVRPVVADEELIAFAAAALESVPQRRDLLYARVDVVRVDGRPLLMELELTEPYLYLRYAEGAVDRFADAVVAGIAGDSASR